MKFKYYSRTPGYETLRVIGMSFLLSIISLALVIGCAILFMLLAGIIEPSRIFGRYWAGQDSQKISNISESSELYWASWMYTGWDERMVSRTGQNLDGMTDGI